MIVISQPTYLPWMGYFGLIDASSKFIFLDDVQFDRRSWQQRNKIIINKKEEYLTIPIIKKGKRDQLLKDTLINNKEFYKNHLKSIYYSYSKTKFFKNYFKHLESLSRPINSQNNLSDINILLIKSISNFIGISSEFLKSSDLNQSGKKSDKLINICKLFNMKKYLSNEGSNDYLKNDIDKFKSNNIEIYIQHFNSTKYLQQSNDFIPYISVLDLLFNEGERSIDIIRSSTEIKKIIL
tara:strand:+ start:601 stop:1314 length:714 start_codon:yes stop_codon:yes gene_type:complete